MVHGSFDIENQYFQGMVESAYKILQPIMHKVLEFEEIVNLKEENKKLKKRISALEIALKIANKESKE